MTRRLIAAASLTAFVSSGLIIAATPATAAEDQTIICIYGDNQRKPGHMQGVCVDYDSVRVNGLPPII